MVTGIFLKWEQKMSLGIRNENHTYLNCLEICQELAQDMLEFRYFFSVIDVCWKKYLNIKLVYFEDLCSEMCILSYSYNSAFLIRKLLLQWKQGLIKEGWLPLRGTFKWYIILSVYLKSDLIRGVAFVWSDLIREGLNISQDHFWLNVVSRKLRHEQDLNSQL